MKHTLTKIPGVRANVVHTYAMIPVIASKSPTNVRIAQTVLHLNNMVWASSSSGVDTVSCFEAEVWNSEGEGLVLRKFRQ